MSWRAQYSLLQCDSEKTAKSKNEVLIRDLKDERYIRKFEFINFVISSSVVAVVQHQTLVYVRLVRQDQEHQEKMEVEAYFAM